MLTPFGKVLKKIRVDKGLRLLDMAQKIGVTAGFLSAVENGKKAIPSDLIDRLSSKVGLTTMELDELRRAAAASPAHVRLDLRGRGDRSRALAAQFGRTFESIDEENAEKLLKELLEW
jgi:transcriptional regulator with XRE-family HTH domain